MTLGITILTPEAIYQSADQILVGGGGRLADPSGKNLTLQYLSWTGYITYAGVGRVGATHTSAIAKRWFAGQADLTFDQVVEIIRIKGGDWLDRVARGHPHTFVLAGFVDGIATCAVISNHQLWHGAPLAPRTRDLVVSAVRATGVPEVVVIGQPQAVHRPDRRILRDLARDHADDPRRIRVALETVSQRAAEREPRLISRECLIFSLDRYGQGQMHPSGTLVAEPEVLMNGMDLRAEIRRLGVHGRLVGMSSVHSGREQVPTPRCQLEVVGDPGDFELVPLETAPEIAAHPQAVNSRGVVVGSASPRRGAPAFPCIWPDPGNLLILPALSEFGGRIVDVNDDGLSVGACETNLSPAEGESRIAHACLWDLEGELTDLGVGLVRDSGARVISRDGRIGGFASVDPVKGGQLHERPATWAVPGQPPEVLTDLGGLWGEVRAFGPEDQLVISTHQQAMLGAAGAIIRDRNGLRVVAPPDADPNGFIPVGMLPDGQLVAMALGFDRRCMVMASDGTWSELPLPRGYEVVAVSDAGWLAGYTTTGHYRTAWVWQLGGNRQPAPLPAWRFHDTQASGVAPGVVVGQASADRCSHPLMWRPRAPS